MNTAPSTSAAVASVPQAGTSGSSGLPAPVEKDKDAQWYFTAEELANSPSRRQGIDSDTELSYRQMTAYLIQEMGQRLKVSQLCINTAIVYMHRFYAFHSFTHFHRNSIASASLFLAAKVEEQPRKLEHVIKAANKCLNQPVSNTVDAQYLEAAQDLVFNENVLLQTLGFDVAIDHPHTHVVKTCHLVKACKDLTKTSYFLASNSLHLTSMCLQYRPTVVACFCIYLACKWSRWEIPQSTEGKHWFHYVDRTVTMELLKQLTDEFIAIYEKSPARLKSKLNSIKALAQGASNNRPVVGKDGKRPPAEEWKVGDMLKMYHSSITISENSNQSGDSAELQQQFNNNAAAMQHSPHAMPMMSILPPPPPAQQQQQQQHLQKQQQMRKSDMHAGQQHRQSSSHHSKHGFPPVGDMTDHKSNYKNQQQHSQQQNFNGNNQNAASSSGSYGSSSRMREHPQVAQQQQQTGVLPPPQSMGQVQRSNMSMSTSNRTSGVGNSNSSHQAQPANMRQQMASGMPMDGQQNYQQKIRERSSSMHSIPNSLHNQMPPHAAASTQQHKLSSKSDVGSSGRMLAPKESSKHKLYGSSGSLAAGSSNAQTSSGMREFVNSQGMTAQAGVGGKMDNPNSSSGSHELARGMVPHNQRSSYANSGNNNNTNNNMSLTNPVLSSLSYNVPPPAIPQQQQQQQSSQHRQAHANMKLEHGGSKSLSGNSATVHNQSQMHKSNLASEPAYSNAAQHDLTAQQQQQQQQMYPPQQSSAHAFASMMRSSSGAGSGFDNMLGEDPLNSLYASGMLQQAHTQMKPSTSSSDPTSMYGTDWAIQQMMNMPSNSTMPAAAAGSGGNGNNNTTETNGSSHRAPPHIKTELSPRSGLSSREKERDRIKVSPSTKKEKHRHSSSSAAAAAAAASSTFPSNIEASNINKSMQQQSQQSLQQQQQQYMYKKPDPSIDQLITAPVAGNKRSMNANIKQEDDALRESKQAKMDPVAAAMLSESKMVSQVVNGIETNPDLVRSLLKESLSANSALIKGEPLLTAPDTKPPAELFATPFDNQQHHAPPSTTYTQSSSSSAAAALASGTQLTASNEAVKPTVAVATVQQASDNATTSTLAEEPSSSKDREKHKKNKKDKHKHKEKDKSKERDREERKKHKKDKDRHKDKERDSEREQPRSNNDRPAGETEQLKIKIRKDQIESSSLNLPPFKIKIPKDRIKGDLNFGGGGGANGAGVGAIGGHLNQFPGSNATGSMATGSNNRLTVAATAATATDVKPHNPTLKIKISKDKIEGYTGCAYQQQPSHTATSMPANVPSAGSTVTSFASTFDPTAAQQNQNFYASFFASQHQPQQQQQIHAPSTSIGSSMSSHSHTHYSSSSGGGGSSKKKDRDRDRDRSKERDRERDKKRHCVESGRTATGTGSGSNMGTLPNVTASSSSHGHGSHPPRSHSTNRH